MAKKLKELSRAEFETLKNTGLLWEIFPEATDTYESLHKNTVISVNRKQLKKIISCWCKDARVNCMDTYYDALDKKEIESLVDYIIMEVVNG